jgi:GNAT superfamily N-acetyltransferase
MASDLQECASAVEIFPLSRERLDDFVRFFEGEAFADNPHWSSCYCQCYYEDHRQVVWKDRTARDNRQIAIERIGRTEMHGLLAYIGSDVVGWCNCAPRQWMHSLDADPLGDAAQVGVIVCFLVAPRWRGNGIAIQLLLSACDALRGMGLSYAEANPRTDARGPAENHYGPLGMYLAAGFEVRAYDDDGSVWVRLPLQ